MATIAAPTVFNTLCRPQTHAENPHSLLTARVIAVDTGFGSRAAATIELWQSTSNNALAKVFRDPLQTLEGCHPPPLGLSLGLILPGNSGRATGDLGLKGRRYHIDFVSFPFQEWNSLKVAAVPALALRVPSQTNRLEDVFVLEGLTIDAEAREGKVENHCEFCSSA